MENGRAKESESLDFMDSKWLRPIVFGVSALIGVGTAVVSIWSEFFHEIKEYTQVKAAQVAKTKRIQAAIDEGAHTPFGTVLSEVHKANGEFTESVSKTMRNIGIPRNPFSGTLERAKWLGAYDVSGIVMKVAASLAVTIGTFYLIDQSARQKASNRRQDKNLRELSERLDAIESHHNLSR